ncbi:MAG: hypothetical protein VXY58_01180, partial [Bacteroidota bacterium]|nr:hypothetical protein [Bacteroidota bacterium]
MRTFVLTLGRLSMLAMLLFSWIYASADWGIYQSYVILDSGSGNSFWAGGENADGVHPSIDGAQLGVFGEGSSLMLNGGELKTWKNGSSNVCSGSVYYRVYEAGKASVGSASAGLSGAQDLGGGNQMWNATALGIDLTAGLTAGDYVLEVWWEADGGTSGGCAEDKYDNNDGNNYKANFTICDEVLYEFNIEDSYGDGIFCEEGAGYTILSDGDVLFTGCDFESSATHVFCLPPDACVQVSFVTDPYPDEISWSLTADGTPVLGEGLDGSTATYNTGGCVGGCTDPTACNYDDGSAADYDDGSCDLPAAGY